MASDLPRRIQVPLEDRSQTTRIDFLQLCKKHGNPHDVSGASAKLENRIAPLSSSDAQPAQPDIGAPRGAARLTNAVQEIERMVNKTAEPNDLESEEEEDPDEYEKDWYDASDPFIDDSELDKYVNKRTAREGYHVADESTIQKTVSRKSDHAKGRKEAGQKRKLPMDGRTGSNGRTKSGRTAHGGSRPVKTDAKGTESNKAGNNNHPTTAEAEQGMEQRDTLVGQQPSPEGAQKQAGSSKQANRDQNPQNNSRDAEEMTTNETEGKRRGKAKFTPPEELNKVVERTKRLAMDQKSSPAPAGTGVGKSKVPQPVENLLGEVGQVLSSNTQKGSVQWAVDQLSSALGDWIKRDTLLKRLSQARKKHLGPVGKVDDEQQQQQQLQEGNHGYDEAAQ